MSLSCSIGDYLRRTAECGDQHRCKAIDHQADQLCNGNGTEDAEDSPLFARPYSFAPRFWLIKVVRAKAKQVMGRKPKPSTLE